MIKFKTYLVEKWKDPHHSEEHDEVHTQLGVPKHVFPDHVNKQLKHLSNKSNFEKAMKSAKTTHIHHSDKNLHKMGNTDAADKRGIMHNPEIDDTKRKRVSNQYDEASSKNKMTKPIILHHKASGHKHLLAGNTRLTHGVQDRKEKVPVHTIEY